MNKEFANTILQGYYLFDINSTPSNYFLVVVTDYGRQWQRGISVVVPNCHSQSGIW